MISSRTTIKDIVVDRVAAVVSDFIYHYVSQADVKLHDIESVIIDNFDDDVYRLVYLDNFGLFMMLYDHYIRKLSERAGQN